MSSYQEFSVGIVRYNTEPKMLDTKVRALFALACQYGVNFFCFAPKDINVEKKTIHGLFWDKSIMDYIRKEVPFPDIVTYTAEFQEDAPFLCEKLGEESHFTHTSIGLKSEVFEYLYANGFSENIIQTYRYNEINLEDTLAKHNSVILKPNDGGRGRGIYKLSLMQDGTYLIHTAHDKLVITPQLFQKQYADIFKRSDYLVQPYVNSTTIEGNPFDIRVQVRRGRRGYWNTFLMYTRVGNSKGVVSNIARGGSSNGDIRKTLFHEFGEHEGERIHKKIWEVAEKLPDILQAKIPYKAIQDIAIDIGIDRDNNNALKFFEVNSGAGNFFGFWHFEVCEADIHFFMFLMDCKKKQQNKGEIK